MTTAVAARTLTDEQRAAVADDGGDLLLSAAAGSGKTSVLVERFVRHVHVEGVAPSRILAITFTEKAAGELRERVRARLLDAGERDAARDAEGAWISTIHGFCARLLRGHAVAAGLDPAFAVLDEPAARALRDAAWDEAFGGWLEEGGADALDLAAAFTADRLRTAVAEAHESLRSAGATSPRLPAPPPGPAPDAGALLRARDAAAAELAALATNGPVVDRARAALERCAELFAAGAAPEPGALAAAAFRPGNAKALRSDACCAYLDAHAAYAGAVVHERAVEAVAGLDALLDRYAAAYAGRKRARSGLDFDDLELLARDLLRDAPSVRRTTAERFERVMVDEFQDSNPLQVELFDLLAAGGAPRFFVGDELQSIYGFRHADVEVFRRRRDALEADGRALALTRTFRARPEIVDAVNTAFDFGPLVAARPDGPPGRPRVEVLVTATEGWDGVELGDLPRAQAWRHAEARLLAQRVADLVAAGDARPEDVAVLVRATGDLPVYERALEDAGLQTLAAGGRGWWGRQVVRDLCAWLTALANPRDELALHGVLASPLVGASTDALALLAGAARPGGVWRAIEEGRADDRLAPADRERIAAFRERFAAERELAPRLTLDELLRRAVEASDYDLHVLRLPGGARRLANVHKLLRLAAEHERDHGRDVRGLADRAAAELDADAREADAPVELGDAKAVRLMTIHAAKGLEFGVVCVADLGRRTSVDAPALLVRDGRIGLRLSHLDGTHDHALDYQALRDRRRADEAAEERRILYVALTRARERLVLSGGADPGRWPGPGVGCCPLAWLGPALLGAGREPNGPPAALPDADDPDRVVERRTADGAAVRLRVALSTPETIGRVLRRESLAPGGTALPPPPEPPARGALPPPAVPAPAVRALSYSALALWKRCGYRFYLQRVLGLPEEEHRGERPAARTPDGGLDPRVRGTLAHEALERDGDPRALVLEAARRHGVGLSDDELEDVARLVAGWAGTALARRVGAAAAVHREHTFSFPLGSTMLTGVVDVLAIEAGGHALVVDYKTDRLAEGDTPAALVARDYGVQRRLYALAALRGGAPGAEVAYAVLERPGEPVVATYAAADAPRLEAELAELARGVHEGRFEVTPEPHLGVCAGCPGRRALCSWPVEMTGRALGEQAPPASSS